MSQANTGPGNWQAAENNAAITAAGSVNSAPTTGPKHYAKILNTLNTTNEPDNQATKTGGGQPSTTGAGHFQRVENAVASSTALHGLGGVPKGFTLDGNRGPGDKGTPAKAL